MLHLMIGITILSIVVAVVSILHHDSYETESIVGTSIVVIVFGIILWIFSISRLETTIDSTHIYYRFPPFVNNEKKLSSQDITELKVRTYRPIWEYGGWGYRLRLRSGRAMTVAGNKGLQLVLSNGKKLLIGTQKPEELNRAVKKLRENWKLNA